MTSEIWVEIKFGQFRQWGKQVIWQTRVLITRSYYANAILKISAICTVVVSDQPVVLNGTNRFADDESHLADNIPKILQLAYFPIAGYSEYKSRENQNEKKNQDKRKYEICFLQLRLTSICSGVHESRFTDLTLDICTPKFRCIPAHRMHRKTPRFHDAHRGPREEDTS